VVVRNLTIDSGSTRDIEDMMSIYLMGPESVVTVVDKKYAALWLKATSLGCVNSTSIVIPKNSTVPTSSSDSEMGMMGPSTPVNNGSTPSNNGSTPVNNGSTLGNGGG